MRTCKHEGLLWGLSSKDYTAMIQSHPLPEIRRFQEGHREAELYNITWVEQLKPREQGNLWRAINQNRVKASLGREHSVCGPGLPRTTQQDFSDADTRDTLAVHWTLDMGPMQQTKCMLSLILNHLNSGQTVLELSTGRHPPPPSLSLSLHKWEHRGRRATSASLPLTASGWVLLSHGQV